jgi:hypothetical protein
VVTSKDEVLTIITVEPLLEEKIMSIRRSLSLLAVFALFIAGFSMARASMHQEASVTITLEDMGLEFGAVGDWEASLYSGADDGQETAGRFTEWIPAVNGEVTIRLPHDLMQNNEIVVPWDEVDDTYVRVRTVGEEPYPEFDLVSDPFTLEEEDYWVHFSFSSMYEGTTGVEGEAEITVQLHDLGGMFGALDTWEASLYSGAVAGEETTGRFTAWVGITNDEVVFSLPDDVLGDQDIPWDEDVYVRVRSLSNENVYPTFDLVGMPFTLVEGQNVATSITVVRGIVEAFITVTVEDMGLEFGAVGLWQASLYSGAEEGAETDGRFTEWKTVQNGQVTFALPVEVRPQDEAPWDVVDDTYVRVRTLEGEYPSFDMVSDPFTLEMMEYHAHFIFEGTNEEMEGGNSAQITVRLEDMGGEFGALDSWQASLYTGATPGQETAGRFTDWEVAIDGEVVFNIPDDVLENGDIPWNEEVYVRIQSLNDEYPEFDLVGRPFTLTDGTNVISTIIVQRSVEEVVEEYVLYLPIILREAVVTGDEE